MKWADKYRSLKIRTNADTPEMARQAVAFGAEGIGLCRTEHMFFDGDRIDYMRQMILAVDEVQRRAALKKLLPFQRKDFIGLFKGMNGRPVTIRLLDPPLHEFLPHDDVVKRQLAEKLGVSFDFVIDRIKSLHEENPMLGCRGCRLGILYPEITEMQTRAIFEAAAQVVKGKKRIQVNPEIMIPLVGFKEELIDQLRIVHRVAREVMKAKKVRVKYTVGTMIEVPRAAITADEIAKEADFFSFGTNDLTQTTLGLSRDDMGLFYDEYQRKEIYNQNPFASLDPRVRVGASVAEPLMVHKVATKEEAKDRVRRLFELVGLEQSMLDNYPHQFSGGQRQRVCIARALALNPELVIADEAVSALDVSVQAQVMNLMLELQQELGLSYLFISHDLAVVERIAHRVAVMYLGQIVELGSREQVFRDPRHSYTKRLLSAVPIADPRQRTERPLLTGEIPSPVWPAGAGPELVTHTEVEPGHLVADEG